MHPHFAQDDRTTVAPDHILQSHPNTPSAGVHQPGLEPTPHTYAQTYEVSRHMDRPSLEGMF